MTAPVRTETVAGVPVAPPLLQVANLTVAFGANRVVDDVSFSIAAGEKFALVGESGSGKTVTALSMLRLNQDAVYGGRIVFDGGDPAATDLLASSERTMRGIRGNRIAMIFQEPMTALNPLFSIGNQIAEVLRLHQGLSNRAAALRTVELLAQTGIAEPARRAGALPSQLSGGQRQRAMIAMALACKPTLLIADEPTTALDVTVQVQIMELLGRLQREENMAVLMISHDLNLVRHFADRVGVMQQGKLIETADGKVLFAAPQQAYTRALLASRTARLVTDDDAADVATQDRPAPLLQAAQLTCRFDIKRGWFRKIPFVAVAPTDLALPHGRTLGIVGESGSGKSTLGMALLRLSVARVAGSITFNGQRIDTLSSAAVRPMRSAMQVVFQDPYASLSPRRTIEQIVGEGLALHQPQLSAAQLRSAVVAALQEVGLPDTILQRYPHAFSGGQRQRIAIARALILKPALLLLDEPTSSLDVSVQQTVLELLAALQQKYGISYLFISHDLAVIRAMAHEVLVMKDGVVVERGAVAEVFSHPRHAYTQRLLAASLYAAVDAGVDKVAAVTGGAPGDPTPG